MNILYHGTDSLSAKKIMENGIDLSAGKESVDNGKGFYMTPNLKFATRRAKYIVEIMKKKTNVFVEPVVLEIKLNITEDELSIKTFDRCSDDWKEFVFLNRLGKQFLDECNITSSNHNLDAKYDVVIDETADNGINMLVSDVKYGELQSSTYIYDKIKHVNAKSNSDDPDWDKQVSIHTKKACSCVNSIEILKQEL